MLFVEFFDMEGYNRYFIGDTICYDFIVRLDKIIYILIRLCIVIEFVLDFDFYDMNIMIRVFIYCICLCLNML